jgi:hypothetical protein
MPVPPALGLAAVALPPVELPTLPAAPAARLPFDLPGGASLTPPALPPVALGGIVVPPLGLPTVPDVAATPCPLDFQG